MNRTSSDSRGHRSSAALIISASRWHTVPVVICRTGTPVDASRRASLIGLQISHDRDLEHQRAFEAFRETIRDLLAMYDVTIDEAILAHDAHPEYLSTGHAAELAAAGRCAPSSLIARTWRACSPSGAPSTSA